MKITAVKKISAVLLTIILMFAFASNAFAETIQDRLEQQLGNLGEQYESADPETQDDPLNIPDEIRAGTKKRQGQTLI